jgi:hypothetical protein
MVDSGATTFTTGGTLNGINVNVGAIAAVGTYKGLNISTNGTARTFTAGATITGINLDLNSNVTATGVGLYGMKINTPGDTSISSAQKIGLDIRSGNITQNTANTGYYEGISLGFGGASVSTTTAAGQLDWYGMITQIPDATANFAGSILHTYGLQVQTGSMTQTAGTLVENGIVVNTGNTSWSSGGTLNGFNLTLGNNLSIPSTGVFNGIYLGTSGTGRTITNSGTFTGINLDLNNNVTANGVSLTGMSVATPADTGIGSIQKPGCRLRPEL